uniref:Uncharacterized protein n=1 Tax=Tanacetum cinerariifolium TaxID=118510 RepID=A0A6L2M2W3_TANCI|nr:hypothetical protein [Tanacetum cinerariifolium]
MHHCCERTKRTMSVDGEGCDGGSGSGVGGHGGGDKRGEWRLGDGDSGDDVVVDDDGDDGSVVMMMVRLWRW